MLLRRILLLVIWVDGPERCCISSIGREALVEACWIRWSVVWRNGAHPVHLQRTWHVRNNCDWPLVRMQTCTNNDIPQISLVVLAWQWIELNGSKRMVW